MKDAKIAKAMKKLNWSIADSMDELLGEKNIWDLESWEFQDYKDYRELLNATAVVFRWHTTRDRWDEVETNDKHCGWNIVP